MAEKALTAVQEAYIQGVSTRWTTRASPSQVSRLCGEIPGLPRAAAGGRVALSLAGCDLSAEAGRIVSVAVTVPRHGDRDLLLSAVSSWIADDHKGLKAALTRILSATTQRCRVHFTPMPAASAWCLPSSPPFAQEDPAGRKRAVARTLMDEAEHDVLAYMTFPREHRQKLHSTNRTAPWYRRFPNEDPALVPFSSREGDT